MCDEFSNESNTIKMDEDSEYKELSGGNVLSENDIKEPPNKKFRPNEELDIRFLISSKVSRVLR